MLSEEKIKKMIRLSDYEKGIGHTDFARTHYAKKDYILVQVLKTILSVVLAGCLSAILFILYHADDILYETFLYSYKTYLIIGGCVISAFLIFVVAVTCIRAAKLYEESDNRVNEYAVTLQELLELYEKEEQGQGQEEEV
jgi:hypothetical protein